MQISLLKMTFLQCFQYFILYLTILGDKIPYELLFCPSLQVCPLKFCLVNVYNLSLPHSSL